MKQITDTDEIIRDMIQMLFIDLWFNNSATMLLADEQKKNKNATCSSSSFDQIILQMIQMINGLNRYDIENFTQIFRQIYLYMLIKIKMLIKN